MMFSQSLKELAVLFALVMQGALMVSGQTAANNPTQIDLLVGTLCVASPPDYPHVTQDENVDPLPQSPIEKNELARSLSDLARFRTKSLILDHQNTFTENQNASYRIVERRI
ncbi:MAG: hypothetical protein EXS31_08250 [Pedosphaera sp.]|nr:hypothetical protein [Pedosphaera sp.]